ncbi:valerianol synthase TPS1B-like [Diospyros lotus]|uniref:valerianol synthase TPS1B-like n=1 Tax=Diospyros lotus TaxID=55363 RepID=UPI00225C0138|nr:valerianol synthase TPS1B-like [Diospyros lotus]
MATSCEVGNRSDQEARPLANFTPSLWKDRFISFSMDYELLKTYTKEVEELKKEVKHMLVVGGDEPAKKMVLINTLERLGVSYLFETEIEEQLEWMFANFEDRNYDLFTIALFFRVFRQHGHKICCDVFDKFRDGNGHFKETLSDDVTGMLSLYEATHLKIHGQEDILDEALDFAKAHLESVTPHLPLVLAEEVMHALKQPCHRGIPRIEARHYISVYGKHDSRDENILRFAKLDFNRLQLLHREELCHISRWWKDLDLVSEVSFARNRIVECFLWSMSAYFEPQYALARMILAKIIAMVTITDDTYDAYGTRKELKLFTAAVQRWDVAAIDGLPDYMKALYRAVLKFYDELDREITKQGRARVGCYAKAAFKRIVRAYDVESEWLQEGYVPSFDEYLTNALETSNCVLQTSSFMGMGELATSEAFEWLQCKPKMMTASALIGRLRNDITSHKDEEKRKHVATGLKCYMEQHGVTEQEAIGELHGRIESEWKHINEEMLRPNAISRHLLMRILNLTRFLDVVYKYDDGFTHPETVLDHINSLFINPINF